jgi:hypothetical protein
MVQLNSANTKSLCGRHVGACELLIVLLGRPKALVDLAMRLATSNGTFAKVIEQLPATVLSQSGYCA